MSHEQRQPFLAWPGWRHLFLTLRLSAALGAWWIVVYCGANSITQLHSYRVRLHFDAELNIPFVPAAVFAYMSIYPLLWSSPFILRQRRDLIAFAVTLATVTGVAGLCFLLFPADSFFPEPPANYAWQGLVRFAKTLALRHNLAPSLHVALSAVGVIVYARRASLAVAALLWVWSVIVAASTMLLHQHYLIDVVTGYLLAWIMVRLVYERGVDWSGDQAIPLTSSAPPKYQESSHSPS